MGFYMGDHDIYVGSVIEQFTLRFAPPIKGKEHYGGLQEVVALQKEFEIFKAGRTFRTSIAALNIGGSMNHETKNRWYKTLDLLRKLPSNVPGMTADKALVAAIIRNLAAKKPLPIYFTSHDAKASEGPAKLVITERGKPPYYLKGTYMVVSCPFSTDRAPAAKKKAVARKKSATK